jgi:hypothetical protein
VVVNDQRGTHTRVRGVDEWVRRERGGVGGRGGGVRTGIVEYDLMGTEGEQMKSDHCARDPYASAENLSLQLFYLVFSLAVFFGRR